MKRNKQLIRLLCGLLCLCLCLSACKKNNPTTTGTAATPKDAIYTISLKTAGGMSFAGLVAYVYEDATEEDLLTYGTLDENGTMTFTAPESDKYTVRFAGLPEEGYDVKEYYPITSTTTDIVLTSSVITGKDALESGKTYGLGDVMRDFTVLTVDGETLTLSEILKDKEAVVLNFWYTGCGPCRSEFPLLQAAYAAYSDKIEVITMNPTDISGDDADKIIEFRDTMGLTMPMATCSSQWLSALGASSYPTTVIIDRYGVICLVEAGAVSESGVFEAAFEHFTAENYQQKLVASFDDLHTVEYAVGHPNNPYQTFGGAEEFEITVEAGAEFYVQLFKGNGILLHVEDPCAYVIYEDVRYEPNKDGVIEIEIHNDDVTAGVTLIFGNTGVTASTIKVKLLIPEGTYGNPYEGYLGEYNVKVEADNSQGVYYEWTATAAGTFTMTVTGAPDKAYDIQLYNLNTYAVRNLGESEQVDEDGNRYVSVDVNVGDVVQITFASLPDANNKYPELTIQAVASFAEVEGSIEYMLTILDDSGNPIPGVNVIFVIDGTETPFVTDENGQVILKLAADMYTVKLTVPEGYICETTQFLLTPSNAAKEVVMQLYVPQELTYTVNVSDELGNPVPGATVILGDVTYYTDEAGMVTVVLLEGTEYFVTVLPPEGYTANQNTYAFGTETVLNVVIFREVDVEKKLDYTVTVVDQNKKAYTDLKVRFDSEDGSQSVTLDVDANGKVTANLPETNYIVTLLFNTPNTMGYETTTSKMTPDKTSLTIEVVPYVSTAGEIIWAKDADRQASYVSTGSVYVDLVGTDIRFFIFTPDKTGTYAITTTNADAAVGYWGSPFFTYDGSSAVEDNVYTFEVKEVGPSIVISVSGGEGISGTVLKITRVGSASKDPERVVFEGTTEPTEPFVVQDSGSKNYFDISVAHTIVKGSDGYYHYGSEDGEIVYIDLKGARYNISIATVIDTSAMYKYEYDNKGNPVKRIDYTECMYSYVNNVDATYGVYALTDDLITIMQEHGNHAGWYAKGNASYLFDGENVLAESAWMFLLCTIE